MCATLVRTRRESGVLKTVSVFCNEVGYHICHICNQSIPAGRDLLLANYADRVARQNIEIHRLNTLIRNAKPANLGVCELTDEELEIKAENYAEMVRRLDEDKRRSNV